MWQTQYVDTLLVLSFTIFRSYGSEFASTVSCIFNVSTHGRADE